VTAVTPVTPVAAAAPADAMTPVTATPTPLPQGRRGRWGIVSAVAPRRAGRATPSQASQPSPRLVRPPPGRGLASSGARREAVWTPPCDPDLRLVRLWFACSPAQPAVASTPRHPGPSYLTPVAGVVGAPWLPPWFHARATSRLSDPFETSSGTSDGTCDHGNNCWRRLGVFSFCF
jgi:hypothetical protein